MGALKRYKTDDRVDAVVVGLGAGGSPLLARLAEAGLSVVALEAGPWYNPEADFSTDELDQSKLFWNEERLSAGETPIAFGSNNSGTGVGGSTLHFTAYVPRPQPDDFKLKAEFGLGEDWPIAFEELEPYLEEAEAILGVSGPNPYPWGPSRRKGYPLPPLSLNGPAEIMQRSCASRGISTSPAPNAALSRPYNYPNVGSRPACVNRGFCQAGCRIRAKGSTDVTFIPWAVSKGAEIRPNCRLVEIVLVKGLVDAVRYLDEEGREVTQPCRHLFLCAGAVETPRLLLYMGLGNSSGQVGRNFMAHVGVQVWGQFDEVVRPWKGVPGGLISEDFHRPKGADFAGGYLLQSIGVMPVTYVEKLVRSTKLFGKALLDHMKGFEHVAGINVLGECFPSGRNVLELSNEMDQRRMPKAVISFSEGPNEKRLALHAEKLMRELWSESRDTWSVARYAHTLGTCRMGTDSDESVVNPEGRSHEISNLTICDGSIFPSSLSVNPALTIMVLSLRTADRFLHPNCL